jgi:hypothetical protein
MTDQDANTLELLIKVRHLRFSMARTALALGLTLVNLAKVESAIGNTDRAESAVDHARKVHYNVQQCLPEIELNEEEKRWVTENLNQLGQALESGSSSVEGAEWSSEV